MAIKTKKGASWGWIVFCFVLFWPIGVVLLINKLAVDKSATIKCGKPLYVVSFILMGMGVIYLIMSLEQSGMIAPAIVFGAPGVWLFFKAKKTRATGKRYKEYIALVINESQTSIDNIASAVGVSYEVAVKDLQKMINADFFHGAQIDYAKREIVLFRVVQQQTTQTGVPFQPQERVAVCQSCGAHNRVIVGQISQCEYCDSLMQ